MDGSNDIQYKLGEMHGDIKSTLAEAKRTNGRVTKLESETVPQLRADLTREIGDLKLKVAYFSGGFSMLFWIIQELLKRYA